MIRVLCLTLILSCLYSNVIFPNENDNSYDSFFKYYIKYCAGCKYSPKSKKENEGNIAGHSVIYLKGACLDKSTEPYTIKLCSEKNPNNIIGLSVGKMLKNVHFFTFENEPFLLGSKLSSSNTFDEKMRDEIIEQYYNSDLMNGITFHDSFFKLKSKFKRHQRSENDDLESEKKKFVSEYIFGTHYSITSARNAYCFNLPLTKKLMIEFIKVLNDLNTNLELTKGHRYRGFIIPGHKKDINYHWHAFYDNCAHLPNNIISDLTGVLKNRPTNLTFFYQLFNLSTPSQIFYELTESILNDDIDPDKIYNNPIMYQIFSQFNWLPHQFGSTVEFHKMVTPNEVYNDDRSIILFPHSIGQSNQILQRIVNNNKYTLENENIFSNKEHLNFIINKYKKSISKINKIIKSEKYLARKRSLKKIKPIMKTIEKLTFKKETALYFEYKYDKKSKSQREWKKISLNKRIKVKTYAKKLKSYLLDQQYTEFIRKLKYYIESEMKNLKMNLN